MPFGKQISPNQVDLPELLRLARTHEGDRKGLEAAIERRFWSGTSNASRKAMNTFLSLRQYEFLEGDQEYALTEVAKRLLSLAGNPDEFYAELARHIIKRLHGMQLLEMIRARQARGEQITAADLARDLDDAGIDAGGKTGEKLNPLRLYLDKAGVFSTLWTIDEGRVEQILGIELEELELLTALPSQQRSFLHALAVITGSPPFPHPEVREVAESLHPEVRFDLKQMPKTVLNPLERQGWITTTKATGGRGAKPHEVTPTKRFRTEVDEPLAEAIASQVHLPDPAPLRRPLSELLEEARGGKSKDIRGIALEGVCIQMMRLLGARFVGWRRRAPDTNYAEVDVVAERRAHMYELLQIQSKVNSITTRDVIDREVGVAQALKSDTIAIISARNIGDAARRAADEHMRTSNLSIVFVDGDDLDEAGSSAEVVALFRREFRHVSDVRRPTGLES